MPRRCEIWPISAMICCRSAITLKDAGLNVAGWQILIWYGCPVTSQCQSRVPKMYVPSCSRTDPSLLDLGCRQGGTGEERKRKFFGVLKVPSKPLTGLEQHTWAGSTSVCRHQLKCELECNCCQQRLKKKKKKDPSADLWAQRN